MQWKAAQAPSQLMKYRTQAIIVLVLGVAT